MPYVLLLAVGAGLAVLLGQLHSHDLKGEDKPLDPHLPEAVERAVFLAIGHEKDPALLRGFGAALLKDFPVAASVLLARATNIEKGTLVNVTRVGLSLNPFRAIKDVAMDKLGHLAEKIPVIKDVKHEVDKIHNLPVFKQVIDTYEAVGTLQPAVFGRMLQKHTAERVLKGERLDRVLNQTRLDAGHWAKNEAAYVAMVPGVGTALAPVYSAAGSLALGEPLPQSIVDVGASALPGGPVVQGAARTGGTFGLAMAEGKKAPDAAVMAVQEALPATARPAFDASIALAKGKNAVDAVALAARGYLPAQARPAFDAGMALAHGQGLQKAGFKAAADLLESQGGSMAERAIDATNLAPMAAQLGQSLEDVAGNRLKGQVAQIAATYGKSAADVVTPVVKRVIANPALANLPSVQAARHLNVPEPVARAALASLKTAGSSFVVNQARLHKLTGSPPPSAPPTVDPDYAKLALAAAKGNASAQKQLSFLKTQTPALAPALADAQSMASQALWTASYLKKDLESLS